MSKFALAAFIPFALGAGCVDLTERVTDRNPLRTDSVSPERIRERTLDAGLAEGLALEIRSSFLGVGGTVSDVLGSEDGVRTAVVRAFDGDRLVLEWSVSGTAGSASGTAETDGFAVAQAMLLPAFWEADTAVRENGLVWLSPKAFRELTEEGRTEWRLGLGDAFLSAVGRLFSSKDPSASPFDLEFKERIGAYPMRLNGRLEHVSAVRASSWFADYLVLDHPDAPLILKVTVNPLAASAFDAFAPRSSGSEEINYEVTSIVSPPSS
jgi:hypothetical protein